MEKVIIRGLISAVVLAVCLGACGSDGGALAQCCSGGVENCGNTSIPWCCKTDKDCSGPDPTGGPVCDNGVCSQED